MISVNSVAVGRKNAHCFMLTVEGRCGGGIAYQDTVRVLPCNLFLDIPVSQGPGKQYPHPSFNLNVVHPSETIGPCIRT